MFKVNTYFDDKVMSMAFESADGPATIGVMAEGEYEFGTSTVEHMTVTSGSMDVLLPGETQWESFEAFDTFIVDKGQKFKVKTKGDTSYRCVYK